MTTSGTYSFSPSLGELVLYAYNNIGVRPTAVLQEHMQHARIAANLLLARWANQGVNLWKVDLVTTTLVAGQASYSVDPTTVMILDAYVVAGGVDRIITPISRTEYAAFPEKDQQGMPIVYWFDRLLQPSITLWQVPDGTSATELKYYRVYQVQDANLQGGLSVDIPYVWLEAFADALSYRLARAWNPVMAEGLKLQADESYTIAANRNVENAITYISPGISGYWRQ